MTILTEVVQEKSRENAEDDYVALACPSHLMHIEMVAPISFYIVRPAAEASEHFVSSTASRSGVYFLREQLFFTSGEWETEFRP